MFNNLLYGKHLVGTTRSFHLGNSSVKCFRFYTLRLINLNKQFLLVNFQIRSISRLGFRLCPAVIWWEIP